MEHTIADVVSQFKREWTKCLAPDAIDTLCKESGLSFRQRLLTPGITIQLMLLQILHGNTAISHLPHLSGMRFWPSSFSRARMRIPISLFQTLLNRISEKLQREDYNKHTWLGHRVFLADGTGISMPDSPALANYFGYPSSAREGVSFPVARLVFMLHLGTGMVAKLLINPFRSHEARYIAQLHPELRENDIFVGDRAFSSFAHFCLLLQRRAHGLIRMNQKMLSSFPIAKKGVRAAYPEPHRKPDGRRQFKVLGKTDHIVEWKKPGSKPKSMTTEQYKALPDSITIRELLYKVSQKGFRTSEIIVLTTLLDEKTYSAKKIAELYKMRWEIETNFNHLKTTMKMDVLKSTTPEGIKRELYAYCILYNLVRLVMIQAAKNQRLPVTRISFVDALRWLAAALPNSQLTTLLVVPHRPGRLEPRSRKRRPKKGFPFALQPRELRKKKLFQKHGS
jgi:hypothetical protein